MKYFILLFLFCSQAQASMYLKVSGETIMGHDYSSHDDYNVEIPDTYLLNEDDNNYKYKYAGGELVEMSTQEKFDHPYTKNKRDRATAIEEHKALGEKLKQYNCKAMSDGYTKDSCIYKKGP